MGIRTSFVGDGDLGSPFKLWCSESGCPAVTAGLCFRSMECLPKVAQNKRWEFPNVVEPYEGVRSFLFKMLACRPLLKGISQNYLPDLDERCDAR
jgi:hypothetical protein